MDFDEIARERAVAACDAVRGKYPDSVCGITYRATDIYIANVNDPRTVWVPVDFYELVPIVAEWLFA